MTDFKKKFDCCTLVFLFSIIASGGFYEEISAIISVALSVVLFLYILKNKSLFVELNITLFSVGLTVFLYLISTLWALDKGTAVLGFIKYLPLLLFLFCISQKKETKENILEILPFVALVLTFVTAVLMQIPLFKPYFSVADRFAGCFQYPNTFALFLLVSELLIISKEKIKPTELITAFLLFCGILYTGSRTVFVLAVLSNFVFLIFGNNKKIKLIFLFSCALCVVAVVIFTLISGENVFGRFLSISLNESTFVGRLLYFKDALPVILKHPFGLGYGGYYYIQQTIQTGVYSVRHIHNDFLQLALDIGWLPLILALALIISALFSKKMKWQRKVILITFVLHSCFDFNLQYLAMCFLLTLLIDIDGKKAEIKSVTLTAVVLGIFAVLNIYFGTVITAYRFSANGFAKKLYPFYTDNNIEILKQCDTAESMEKTADEILKQNKYIAVCYSAKAKTAYSKGKFNDVIKYKHLCFDYAPFSYDDYEEYCYMLINGISLYTNSSDTQSADFCKKELLSTYTRLQNTEKRLSKLGSIIKDKPKTELPEDIMNYINGIKGGAND